MSYEITDEQIAEIESYAKGLELCDGYSDAVLYIVVNRNDMIALISRLRAAEAKLNSICVENGALAEVVSGYSGDPDTRGSRTLRTLKNLPKIGTKLYALSPAGEEE